MFNRKADKKIENVSVAHNEELCSIKEEMCAIKKEMCGLRRQLYSSVSAIEWLQSHPNGVEVEIGHYPKYTRDKNFDLHRELQTGFCLRYVYNVTLTPIIVLLDKEIEKDDVEIINYTIDKKNYSIRLILNVKNEVYEYIFDMKNKNYLKHCIKEEL